MLIWYIFPVLVCCSKKNLATLILLAAKFSKVWTEEKEK
jgi:hypothetical protein